MESNISSRRINARKAGDDEYEKKRKKIIFGAAAVFKEKGYEAANVGDIAKKAGIDRASIYYYYKGKTELFREMVEEAMTGNVVMAEQIAASDQIPLHKLKNLVERLFESYERHYPYLFVYVQEDMARMLSDKTAWNMKMRSLSKRFDVAIIKIIQDGIDDGSFNTKGNAKLLAAGIIGMCNWSHRWFDPGKFDRNQIAQVFSDLILEGLKASRKNKGSG
jgi:AcrR family transcriptional regulator